MRSTNVVRPLFMLTIAQERRETSRPTAGSDVMRRVAAVLDRTRARILSAVRR
jgi:hypothetical protein